MSKRGHDDEEACPPPKRAKPQAKAERPEKPAVTCAKKWLGAGPLPVDGIVAIVAEYATSFQGRPGSQVEPRIVHAMVPIGVGMVAMLNLDGVLNVLNVSTGELVCTIGDQSKYSAPMVPLSTGSVAVGNGPHINILSLQVDDDKPAKMDVFTLTGHHWNVRVLAELPGGTIASAGDDHTILVSYINSDDRLCVLRGHLKSVHALAPLPKGRLASGSADKTARVWCIADGTLEHTLPHADQVVTLEPLPDGWLATGSLDRVVRLWGENGECLQILMERHPHPTQSLVAVPGGKLYAASNYSSRVVEWDCKGKDTTLPSAHRSGVLGLKLLPDGTLLSWGCDGMVCITDPVTGEFITLSDSLDFTRRVQHVAVVKIPGSNMYTLVVSEYQGAMKIYLF